MVSMKPQLAFFCPQRYRQKICTAGIYRIDNMILAHFADLAETGIHRSHTSQAVWLCIKFFGSGCGDTFRATEQEDGKPTRPGARGLESIEEIRTRQSFFDRQA